MRLTSEIGKAVKNTMGGPVKGSGLDAQRGVVFSYFATVFLIT
jgi:hypothetical protein